MAESADERDSYACAVQSDLLRNIKVAGVPYIKLQVTTNNGKTALFHFKWAQVWLVLLIKVSTGMTVSFD